MHDEASMRVRSFIGHGEQPHLHNALCRGKSSKVQNHVVTAHIGEASVEAYAELQALATKDGATVAHSIITTLKPIMESLVAGIPVEHRGSTKVRLIHLLTGDAIPTNEAAAKRVLEYFFRNARRLGLRYAILVFKCSSHQSNLVVQVAICGKILTKVLEVNALCGTCSRLFKYLMPDYLEDFNTALKRLVWTRFTVLEEDQESPDAITHRQHSADMQQLYPVVVNRGINRDQ